MEKVRSETPDRAKIFSLAFGFKKIKQQDWSQTERNSRSEAFGGFCEER